MTIKEVPTHILRESLLAIADLGRKYRGEEMVTAYKGAKDGRFPAERCPLCQLNYQVYNGECSNLGEGDPDHKNCLWWWIEGFDCHGRLERHIPARLSRIARWEEAINAELAGRAE